MQDDIEVMKKYYSTEEAWEKHRHFYEEGPSREWQELYRDIKAVLGEDPAGPTAQTLADRWLKRLSGPTMVTPNSKPTAQWPGWTANTGHNP